MQPRITIDNRKVNVNFIPKEWGLSNGKVVHLPSIAHESNNHDMDRHCRLNGCEFKALKEASSGIFTRDGLEGALNFARKS